MEARTLPEARPAQNPALRASAMGFRILCVLVALGACSTTGSHRAGEAVPDRPDALNGSYHFTGRAGPEEVTGDIHFDEGSELPVRVTVSAPDVSCIYEIREVSDNLTIRCQGMNIQLLHNGVVRELTRFSVRAPVIQEERQCVRREVDQETGIRSCVEWAYIPVTRTVLHRGTALVSR